jgi:DNA repair protein RecO (recombination protein O)
LGVPAESKGIILFTRDYKEKDKLVKIFTESAGKRMFFVKGAHRRNNPLMPALQPFTEATYIGEFKPDGLSFLNGAKDVKGYRLIQGDIFLNAYATYILNLTDKAIEDNTYDPSLFHFVETALTMMDQGYDGEIIMNIFEVQIMKRFGVGFNWQNCAICGKQTGAFDFSSKYHGVLCQEHWGHDARRYHANPKAIHFIRMFSQISYDKIDSITVSEETKKEIRKTLDTLYEEFVGLNLKSKHFIDQMHTWSSVLKPRGSSADPGE